MANDADLLPDRDDQCPGRGPSLSHIQDGTLECIFCGQAVVAKGKRRRRRRAKRHEDVEFSDDEVRKLEFLRHLRRTGRL